MIQNSRVISISTAIAKQRILQLIEENLFLNYLKSKKSMVRVLLINNRQMF